MAEFLSYMMGHVGIQNKDKIACSVLDSVNVCGAWKGGKMNVRKYKKRNKCCLRLVMPICARVPYPIPAFLHEVSTAIMRNCIVSDGPA